MNNSIVWFGKLKMRWVPPRLKKNNISPAATPLATGWMSYRAIISLCLLVCCLLQRVRATRALVQPASAGARWRRIQDAQRLALLDLRDRRPARTRQGVGWRPALHRYSLRLLRLLHTASFISFRYLFLFFHAFLAVRILVSVHTSLFISLNFFSTEYYEYFSPDFSLHPNLVDRKENMNSRQVSVFILVLLLFRIPLQSFRPNKFWSRI